LARNDGILVRKFSRPALRNQLPLLHPHAEAI